MEESQRALGLGAEQVEEDVPNHKASHRRSIVLTLLFSGKKAAYYVVWLVLLRMLATPVDWLLARMEQRKVGLPDTPATPPLLIIGPHRAGVTFAAQVLADALPMAALGNFETVFSRSHHYGQRLKRRWVRHPSGHYSNYYGISTGLGAIGDCHRFWDRWCEPDHHTMPTSLPEQSMAEIRQFFASCEAVSGQPVIAKMARGALQIDFLQQLFPGCFFVVVDRDPCYVVQSLLFANKDFYGDSDANAWAPRVEGNIDGSAVEDGAEWLCQRHHAFCQRLEAELAKLPETAFVRIRYEDLCADPVPVLERVAAAAATHLGAALAANAPSAPFNISRRIRDAEQFAHIQACWQRASI